jgi:hypothetical protein
VGDHEDVSRQPEPDRSGLTRRDFIYGTTVAAAGTVVLTGSRGTRPGSQDDHGDVDSVRRSSDAALEGLYVRYYTASFTATDGNFYLMDVTDGDVTMQLPPVDTMPASAILGFKRVGSANSVIIKAASGEHINGRDQISTDQAGWARIILPFAPAGAAAGTGWMSY